MSLHGPAGACIQVASASPIHVQSNLSIPDTLGHSKTVLIIEVSLYFRGSFIHIYIVVGPQLTVLIIEVSLFQSVHNSRFDCIMYFQYNVYLSIVVRRNIYNINTVDPHLSGPRLSGCLD